VFRTVGDQPSLFEAVLPPVLLRLPEELARVDAMLDDPAFFAPFVPFFDPRIGRPSTPMETYLRLMFLKYRYRLGYESLCREVSDSITWRRFRVTTRGLSRLGLGAGPAQRTLGVAQQLLGIGDSGVGQVGQLPVEPAHRSLGLVLAGGGTHPQPASPPPETDPSSWCASHYRRPGCAGR